MGAWDFNSGLDCKPSHIYPVGGVAAVEELASALQVRWPAITPDTSGHWGPKRPALSVLYYRANGQEIEIRVSLQFANDPMNEKVSVLVEFDCKNPPEVEQTSLELIQWLMETYEMECSPGYALSEVGPDDAANDELYNTYTSFEEALPVLKKRMARTRLFWETYFPERCGFSKPAE